MNVTRSHFSSLGLVLLVAACGDTDESPGAAAGGSGGGPPGAQSGAAQIGIGTPHDPAWVTVLGGPGSDEALAVSASAAGVFLGGKTSSSWFRTLADTCDPNIPREHAGEDCADAFVMRVGGELGIQFGDPQSDEVKFLTAMDDAVYACGNYREPRTGKYQKDGFVARFPLDLSAMEWESAIRNPGKVDELMGVAVSGDVFVAGGSAASLDGHPVENEDGVVARITPAGVTGNTEQLGQAGLDELMGIAADAGGAYAIGATAGWLDDDSGQNPGSTDAILLAFDPTLAPSAELCRVQLGTELKDVGQAVITVGDFIYVAGYTEGRINGALENGASCNQDDSAPSDAFRSDAFIAKYDKQCSHVWTRQFGSDATDAASALASDGELLYVTGFFGSDAEAHGGTTSATHAFLRAYDLDGNVSGELTFESSAGTDIGQGIAVDAGHVYLAGGTNGVLGSEPSLGQRDAFLARIPVVALKGNATFTGSGCP